MSSSLLLSEVLTPVDPVNSSKHTDSGWDGCQGGRDFFGVRGAESKEISGGEGVDPNRNDLALMGGS